MFPCNLKKNCRNISRILLTISLCMPGAPAHAEFPDVGVFANAVEVDDSELEQMRGKFVSPGQITYFGVEMQTQWQTGSGEVLSAGMKMDMSFPDAADATPVVNLVPTVSIAAAPAKKDEIDFKTPVQPGLTPGPDTTISSSGLNNITGVVQSIQAGGDNNQITNTLEMNVIIQSSSENNTTTPVTLSLTPFSTQTITDNGSVALAGVSENSIQTYSYVPNQGEIIQRISGVNAGGGVIMQSVRVIGNQHKIVNTMTITASFRAVSSTFNNSTLLSFANFF